MADHSTNARKGVVALATLAIVPGVGSVPEDLAEQMACFDQAVAGRDRQLAESVLHRDFALVLVHPRPATMPRERWLEVLADYRVHQYTVQEQTVDVDEDVAAVLTRVDMEATVLGEPRNGLFAISDVWRRDGDKWRVWRRHSTPLEAGEMPG